MPRHVVAALTLFFALVFSTSAVFSWVSVHLRLPLVHDLLVSLQAQESKKTQDFVSNNLQLMANRLGELQAKVLQLDILGERVSGLSGVSRNEAVVREKGQGGPFVPAPMTAGELQREIEKLAFEIESRNDEFAVLESRLLERRVQNRLLPTTLPVKEAELGSPFGRRTDPIFGFRAMHQGIDFNAETGTSVVVAADGVVLSATYHPDFGNVIDVDHGDGLVSRYAHLSRLAVKPGTLVKRGALIGAVGSTGRSTGPHLHFEVLMFGVPQNPALFLKQGPEFAQIKRR